MSASLRVAEYDEAEDRALEAAPNRIIECCQPTTFHEVGYPIRVKTHRALWRSVDAMHETRFEHTLNDILGGRLSPAEFSLLKEINQRVAELSELSYGRRCLAVSSLLRAFTIARHMSYICPSRSATILEIGGGSGYVSALLAKVGFRVITTDIAQAFYIYQSNLFETLFHSDFLELATNERSFDELASGIDWRVAHVPWWKFYTLRNGFDVEVDFVTCNHCLCEMHPRALLFFVRACRALLGHSKNPFCGFAFEGYGSTIRRSLADVGKVFSNNGLSIAHADSGISFWAPLGTKGAENGLKLPVQDSHPTLSPFHPREWSSDKNPVSKRIIQGRKEFLALASVGSDSLQEFFRTLLHQCDLRTEDEKFADFIDIKF